MATTLCKLLFKLNFEGELSKDFTVFGYAFTPDGKFLDQAILKKGQVELNLTVRDAPTAQIFFGPGLVKKIVGPPTIDMMEKIKAYKPKWSFKSSATKYEISAIPESCHKSWSLVFCHIQGHVLKHFVNNGVTITKPVFNARVHICEIDKIRFIIPRLPKDILLRLRDELIIAIEKPHPGIPPIPDPPLIAFDPGFIDPSPIHMANIAHENKTSMVTGNFSKLGQVSFNPQPEPPREPLIINLKNPPARAVSLPQVIPANLKKELKSTSVDKVRLSLINNVNLIYPHLCYWPWFFPYFYQSIEMPAVYTNEQGLFEADCLYLQPGDHPDLYFWVEYRIGEVWTTVYRPPIPCHTYWDYPCGMDVTISITDPRVTSIEEPPSMQELMVGVINIGYGISLHQINHNIPDTSPEYKEKAGLTINGEPFGGSIEPEVWFGKKLIENGITHYKWSYRKIMDVKGDVVTDDEWHAMDRLVIRHYAVSDPDHPHSISFKPALMGPDPAFPDKNLIKIQPQTPPEGDGWAPLIDIRENSASSFFLSHLLKGGDPSIAAGKYELKLELFRSDGITNASNLVTFCIPKVNAPVGMATDDTDPAGINNLITDPVTNVVTGFSMVIHVDNNVCEGEIFETSVNLEKAGNCGFIKYVSGANNALISFLAYHPNGFARFRFTTVKGSSGNQTLACIPPDPNDPSAENPLVTILKINDFKNEIVGDTDETTGNFTKSIPVDDLLGECKLVGRLGGKACFGENLAVYATATDGWSNLSYLNSYPTPKAFALEP